MILFNTDSRRALSVGIIVIGILLVAILAAIALAVILPRSIVTHFLITLALGMVLMIGWLIYHIYALVHTSYSLDRNAFVIRWGLLRQIVPMGDIQRVIPAAEIQSELKLTRVPLPYWWVGQGFHPALGKIQFFCNAPLAKQLIIIGADGNYSVSPYDTAGFLEAFGVRHQMGPTQAVHPARLQPRFMTWPIWNDRLVHILVLTAIGLNALLFAIGFARYPALPGQVVLHFDALGKPDRLASVNQIFGPAIIALELFLVNFLVALGVYVRGDKLAAYLAWGGSAVVQLLFLIAMITVAFTPA